MPLFTNLFQTMKAKFGSIIVAGSGKIGGHVASRNRSGAYLRTKVTPVNPNTAAQTLVRARLAARSQEWRALDADERDAWNAVVGDYAKTDVFGDLKNPSGFNLYQRLNNNLVNIGEAVQDTPPVPQDVINFTSLSVACSIGGGTLTLTFAAAIAATEKIKLFATPPMSAGVNFVKSEFRQIDVLQNGDASPYDCASEYEAVFGSLGAQGQKIFVKLVPVSVASGQEGIGIVASCINGA